MRAYQRTPPPGIERLYYYQPALCWHALQLQIYYFNILLQIYIYYFKYTTTVLRSALCQHALQLQATQNVVHWFQLISSLNCCLSSHILWAAANDNLMESKCHFANAFPIFLSRNVEKCLDPISGSAIEKWKYNNQMLYQIFFFWKTLSINPIWRGVCKLNASTHG